MDRHHRLRRDRDFRRVRQAGRCWTADIMVMCVLAVSVLVLSRTRSGRLSRAEGTVLLVMYAAYIGYQVWQAVATRTGVASP